MTMPLSTDIAAVESDLRLRRRERRTWKRTRSENIPGHSGTNCKGQWRQKNSAFFWYLVVELLEFHKNQKCACLPIVGKSGRIGRRQRLEAQFRWYRSSLKKQPESTCNACSSRSSTCSIQPFSTQSCHILSHVRQHIHLKHNLQGKVGVREQAASAVSAVHARPEAPNSA